MGGATRLLMLLTTPFPLLYRRSTALRLAPLSTAASALSRLSSSGPTSRPGFSVRAAEQVHTQASVSGAPPEHLPASRTSHPWPEWSKLVDHLISGYSAHQPYAVASSDDDSFAVDENLPWEFLKAAEACLSYARDRPDVLRLLSRKDVEVVVGNGSPFLFKNGANSTMRMRSFLSGDESQVMVIERAQTVDIMRYLLSYACSPLITSEGSSVEATELTEEAVRNLLNQLVNVSGSARDSNFVESDPRDHELRQEQFSSAPRKNIEMKRGDWICLKCSFMNFARNVKCLECSEGRPKRQLTGGEWECPQCDFFNYGKNTSCLRCDCKRPEHAPLGTGAPGTTSGYTRNSSFEQILNGINTDKSEVEQRLAANDEKAERWFSKVAQLDNASDLSRAADDEDFPEIMPMRKGENRFVVSTRKTPLERRLANAQNRNSLGIENVGSGNDSGGLSGRRSERTSESSISQSLDRILGRTPSSYGTQSAGAQVNDGVGSRLGSSENRQSVASQRKDPDYVPFVPLPADMFGKSKKSDSDMQQGGVKEEPYSVSGRQQGDSTYKLSESLGESMVDKESSDVSARLSRKVDEPDNVADLTNAISDEAFPEIMPMRKGENRFVVSKKKDRSLTSPQYKRRLAMEQANNSNFVPFVPFPPDYFAKKDKQTETFPVTTESSTEGSTPQEQIQGVTEKSRESRSVDFNAGTGTAGNLSQENSADNIINREFSTKNKSEMGSAYSGQTSESVHAAYNSWNDQKDAWNTGPSQKTRTSSDSSGTGTSLPPPPSGNLQGSRESWKFSGKSLEGSAVKETDPLDMSEEAKAERWFRRVAQIKDISELSQIPDEDFPEIMPMRKGVNRFVVSKRKTPLERRLTSPQYRRNLPIVSSEPEKDGS